MKVLPRGDRQPVEGILQVLSGIDAELLTGLGEGGRDRQGPSAPVRAEEQAVFPPDREGLHRPLRRIVIDRAGAVGGVRHQRVPLVQGVIHPLHQQALRQERGLHLLQPRLQVFQQGNLIQDPRRELAGRIQALDAFLDLIWNENIILGILPSWEQNHYFDPFSGCWLVVFDQLEQKRNRQSCCEIAGKIESPFPFSFWKRIDERASTILCWMGNSVPD